MMSEEKPYKTSQIFNIGGIQMKMMLGMEFSEKSETNVKHITAIRILVGRSYKIIFMDDRTRHFQVVKPFAYDEESYFVVCPCCHQIERVSDNYFIDKTKAVIQCSNRTITQKTYFKEKPDSIEMISGEMSSFTLDLTDWKL